MSRRAYQEDTEPDAWFRPTAELHAACCDCGLVHVFRYRSRKSRVEVKVVRDARKTAAFRRERRKRMVRVVVRGPIADEGLFKGMYVVELHRGNSEAALFKSPPFRDQKEALRGAREGARELRACSVVLVDADGMSVVEERWSNGSKL